MLRCHTSLALVLGAVLAVTPGCSRQTQPDLTEEIKLFQNKLEETGTVQAACNELDVLCKTTGFGCKAHDFFCNVPTKEYICQQLAAACSNYPAACDVYVDHCKGTPDGDGGLPDTGLPDTGGDGTKDTMGDAGPDGALQPDAAPCSDAGFQSNDLPNSSFESGLSSPWVAWTGFDVVNDGNARSGQWAIKLSFNAAQGYAGGSVDQSVTPGQSYQLSVWGKSAQQAAFVGYKFFDAAKQQLGAELTSAPFGVSYTQRSFTFTAPAQAATVQIFVMVKVVDSAYIDDVTLSEACSASPPPPAGCQAAPPPGAVKTLLVSPSNSVSVPKDFVGIHLGLHTPNWLNPPGAAIAAPTYPYGYVRTLRADVDGTTEVAFWSNIEKTKGNYDWTLVDKWIAATAGHPVIWLVYGTPSFYQKYQNEPSPWPSWPGINSPPTDAGHAALASFVKAVKQRYGNRIVAFEVWNEPTLPWTGGPTSYNDRWSPAWVNSLPPQDRPNRIEAFFSGSASDLANIAYTLKQANLGVPILGAAFVDVWAPTQTTVTRFLNAPVTLPGATGTGKDQIDGLSMHFYDYSYNPSGILAAIDGFRAKLTAAGVGQLPLWDTETGAEDSGVFSPNDPRAPVSIKRWSLLGAAKGLQSMVLYAHASKGDAIKTLGDPANNPAAAAAIAKAASINGKTICNAALLSDGRVWVTTADGTVYLE
jgi:hypothetical protein